MQIAMPDRNLQNIPHWILLDEKDPIKRYAISQISSLSSIYSNLKPLELDHSDGRLGDIVVSGNESKAS